MHGIQALSYANYLVGCPRLSENPLQSVINFIDSFSEAFTVFLYNAVLISVLSLISYGWNVTRFRALDKNIMSVLALRGGVTYFLKIMIEYSYSNGNIVLMFSSKLFQYFFSVYLLIFIARETKN